MNKMHKLAFSIIFTAVMLLAGCGNKETTNTSDNETIENPQEGTMETKINENPHDEEDEVLDCISELFSLKNLLIAMFIIILDCVYIAYEIHAINTDGFSLSKMFINWLFSLADTVRGWLFSD